VGDADLTAGTGLPVQGAEGVRFTARWPPSMIGQPRRPTDPARSSSRHRLGRRTSLDTGQVQPVANQRRLPGGRSHKYAEDTVSPTHHRTIAMRPR